jgi:hypothetical protein
MHRRIISGARAAPGRPQRVVQIGPRRSSSVASAVEDHTRVARAVRRADMPEARVSMRRVTRHPNARTPADRPPHVGVIRHDARCSPPPRARHDAARRRTC